MILSNRTLLKSYYMHSNKQQKESHKTLILTNNLTPYKHKLLQVFVTILCFYTNLAMITVSLSPLFFVILRFSPK